MRSTTFLEKKRRFATLAGVALLWLCAQGASAQTTDTTARGSVGVVQGQIGVDRSAVDGRSACARDRLVGQRPQPGVPRGQVGAPRTPILGASPPPDRPKNPCERN